MQFPIILRFARKKSFRSCMILRHFQPKQKDGGRPNGYRVLSNQYKMNGFEIYHPKSLSLDMTPSKLTIVKMALL